MVFSSLCRRCAKKTKRNQYEANPFMYSFITITINVNGVFLWVLKLLAAKRKRNINVHNTHIFLRNHIDRKSF